VSSELAEETPASWVNRDESSRSAVMLILTEYLRKELPQIVPYLHRVIHVEVDGYWWVVHPDHTYCVCPLEEIFW